MKITIVLCWLSLFSFWLVKLFGGDWFSIIVKNENFVEFSNMVQSTWLKYLVSFFTIFLAKYLTIGAICQKMIFKGKQLLVVATTIISIWAIVNFVPFDTIRMLYPYAIILMLAFAYQRKWRKLYGVIAIALEFAFATISMATRNVPIGITENYFVAIILSIDMYIMATLYMLYMNLIKITKGENL